MVSGNISRSLNKNVLKKVIKSELSQRTRMHDDVFMELYLTQNIMRECDTGFRKISGYIQLLQVDPFCVHMYTEAGINILVQQLRDKKPRIPVTLKVPKKEGKDICIIKLRLSLHGFQTAARGLVECIGVNGSLWSSS